MIDVVSGDYYFYHFDALGSVVALSDSSGSIVAEYEYEVFGSATITGNGHGNPFMFTGRRFDDETGLYYYRARMYHPELGRFMQPDPIGYLGGINLYTYVGNNPLNWIDPLGLKDSSFGWRLRTERAFWRGVEGVAGGLESVGRYGRGITASSSGLAMTIGGGIIIVGSGGTLTPAVIGGIALMTLGPTTMCLGGADIILTAGGEDTSGLPLNAGGVIGMGVGKAIGGDDGAQTGAAWGGFIEDLALLHGLDNASMMEAIQAGLGITMDFLDIAELGPEESPKP